MKKIMLTLATIATVIFAASAVNACPLWSCNYDYYDYTCGCQCNTQAVAYNCETVQPILYCQYCGNETWACTCGTEYNIECDDAVYETEEPECYYEESEIYYDQDCSYNESEEYSGAGYNGYSGSGCGCTMAQWANIRNGCGVIIAQAGAGDYIEICGTEADTGRVLIYDYTIGVYGSVLSECIYGTYQWDGTGDNGAYNQYNGSYTCTQQTCGSCGYAVSSCVCNQVCYQPVYCTYTYNTCCY